MQRNFSNAITASSCPISSRKIAQRHYRKLFGPQSESDRPDPAQGPALYPRQPSKYGSRNLAVHRIDIRHNLVNRCCRRLSKLTPDQPTLESSYMGVHGQQLDDWLESRVSARPHTEVRRLILSQPVGASRYALHAAVVGRMTPRGAARITRLNTRRACSGY